MGTWDIRFTGNSKNTLGERFLPDQFKTILDTRWTEVDPEEHPSHWADPRRQTGKVFMGECFEFLAAFGVKRCDGVRVGQESVYAPVLEELVGYYLGDGGRV